MIQYADSANKAGKPVMGTVPFSARHTMPPPCFLLATVHCVHYSSTVKYASVYADHDVFVTNNIKIITTL